MARIMPYTGAHGSGFVEDSPSRVIDPEEKKKKQTKKDPIPDDEDITELIESSPFEWNEEEGYVVPGEDLNVLSGRLDSDQLKEVEEKASVMPARGKPRVRRGARGSASETVTISTDTVDDRFDNI